MPGTKVLYCIQDSKKFWWQKKNLPGYASLSVGILFYNSQSVNRHHLKKEGRDRPTPTILLVPYSDDPYKRRRPASPSPFFFGTMYCSGNSSKSYSKKKINTIEIFSFMVCHRLLGSTKMKIKKKLVTFQDEHQRERVHLIKFL